MYRVLQETEKRTNENRKIKIIKKRDVFLTLAD